MSKQPAQKRDRRFDNARRRLHYRIAVMQFEQREHSNAPGHSFAGCNTCQRAWARMRMVEEIIREFGGRA